MVGHYHRGDENGKSAAKFAALVLSDDARNAGFQDVWLMYDDVIREKESKSEVMLSEMDSPAIVITGRKHDGDENGYTEYQTAKVVASRVIQYIGTDEEVHEHISFWPCMVMWVSSINTPKESSEGWVEDLEHHSVIIGRTHKGDENAETTTYFAAICIKEYIDGQERFYRINLGDIVETEEVKESHSNLYVDCPSNDNTFTIWASHAVAGNLLDHTWVESKKPHDKFCCMGNTDPLFHLADIGVDDKAYLIMRACRGGWLFFYDTIGIIYLWEGVCHQMSNRFVFPMSGQTMMNKEDHPKGYGISRALYGLLGRDYDTWYKEVFTPQYEKYEKRSPIVGRSVSDVCVTELEMLQKEAQAIFMELGISVPENAIMEAQQEWLKQREIIMREYGFLSNNGSKVIPDDLTAESICAMVEKVINAQRKFQIAVRDKLGQENFKLLTGGESEPVDIVDVDTAMQFYLG